MCFTADPETVERAAGPGGGGPTAESETGGADAKPEPPAGSGSLLTVRRPPVPPTKPARRFRPECDFAGATPFVVE